MMMALCPSDLAGVATCASACRIWGSESPPRARPPILRNCLREPSHCRCGEPGIESIVFYSKKGGTVVLSGRSLLFPCGPAWVSGVIVPVAKRLGKQICPA